MVEIVKLNESLIRLNTDFGVAKTINEHFSFYTDNYRWHPKYKAGIWDGKISLFNMRNGTLPQGLLVRLLSFLSKINEDFVLDVGLKRQSFDVDMAWVLDFVKNTLKINDIIPRDYQIAGILDAIRANKGGLVLPTGSGKSFVQYVLISILRHFYPDTKILMIVPTIGLVNQMRYDFLDYAKNLKNFEKNIHIVFGGKEKETDKPIAISTWQSLQELPKKYFEQYDALFVDEFHLANGKEITRIVECCSNAKYKIGMSGTLEDAKVKEIQLEALFGKVKRIVSTKKLQKQGYLSPLKITNFLLNYPKEICADVSGMAYFDEMKFLMGNEVRTKFIVNLASSLKGTSLLIFKNVSYGKELYRRISEKCKDRNVYYVSGETPGDERERVRLAVEKDENAIIVASVQVFSTGINIKKLEYLMFTQSTKSKIKVLQSIGRILRKHKTKEFAVLLDVVDNLSYRRKKNYSLKHALERLKFYEREGFEYSIKEINF